MDAIHILDKLVDQHHAGVKHRRSQAEQNALQITTLESQIQTQAADFDNRIYQMELQRYELQKELVNTDVEGEIIIRALTDGKVDSLSVTVGQMVNPGDNLLQVIPENPFSLEEGWFNPTILYEGSANLMSSVSVLNLKQGGCSGWRFEDEPGIDLSKYNYLVIRLARNAAKNVFFRIYDTSNYWADCYMLNMGGAKEFKIDLHAMKTEAGEPVDPSRIRIAGFNSAASDQSLYVKEVFLSYDGDNPASAIESVDAEANYSDGVHYSIDGRRVATGSKGIHVVRYKDGSSKKIIVR